MTTHGFGMAWVRRHDDGCWRWQVSPRRRASRAPSVVAFEVVGEIEFDGETVRLVGLPDAQIPSYRFWLPHGTGPRSYYRAELDALTSILRPGEEDPNRTRCVEETVAAVETIVDSLGPDPETTIDEVREKNQADSPSSAGGSGRMGGRLGSR